MTEQETKLRAEILLLRGQLRYQKAVADLNDHADVIDSLRAEIRHLENINNDLRREVRIQRYEIAALHEERKILLERDNPFPKPGPDDLQSSPTPAWGT